MAEPDLKKKMLLHAIDFFLATVRVFVVAVYCNKVLVDDMYSNEDIAENSGGGGGGGGGECDSL